MVRVNEVDRYLVADIIVGYYNRQNFRDSQLLADRHSSGSKPCSSVSTPSPHRIVPGGGSDSTDSSGQEEDVEIAAPQAAPDGLCFPLSLSDDDQELEPALHLRTSMIAARGGGKPSRDFTGTEGGEGQIMKKLTLAEQRRDRRRQRRQVHQDRLRQNEAERQSERRRMRADRERRDREVARAVREAEDAERVRLLREAQEAENNAPIAARLMRTMQKKAAGAVAAAKSTAAAGAGVADIAAGGGPTRQTVAADTPAHDGSSRHEPGEKKPQQAPNMPGGDDFPADSRPSQVRFDKGEIPLEKSRGNDFERRRRSNDGDGGDFGGQGKKGEPPADNKVGAALPNAWLEKRETKARKGSEG